MTVHKSPIRCGALSIVASNCDALLSTLTSHAAFEFSAQRRCFIENSFFGIGNVFESVTRTVVVLRPAELFSAIKTIVSGRRRSHAHDAFDDAASILGFLGLAGSAGVPAGELTPAKQRLLEIGMALGARPRLLLLDEVAAGLTEGELQLAASLIRRVRDELGVAVIWIEHAVRVLMQSVERVVVLHQGRKIADGRPQDVARDAAVVEAYLGGEA